MCSNARRYSSSPEPADSGVAPVSPKQRPPVGVDQQGHDLVAQSAVIAGADEDAGRIANDVRDPAHRGRDNRATGRHRFDDADR